MSDWLCKAEVIYSAEHCTNINFVMKRANEDVPILDRIVCVCCALNNLCDSVVLLNK